MKVELRLVNEDDRIFNPARLKMKNNGPGEENRLTL